MLRTKFLKQVHGTVNQFYRQLPILNWYLFYSRMMGISKNHDYEKVKCPSLYIFVCQLAES